MGSARGDAVSSRGVLAYGLMVLASIPNVGVADTQSRLTNTVKTPSTTTPISRTQEVQTLAKHWGLDPEEYQTYLDLMRGPLGKWNPDLDPLVALGMFATSPQQERRYAELHAQQEFDLTERTLQFQQAYRSAFDRLYPNQSVLDQRLLAPYFAHEHIKSTKRAAKRLAQKRFKDGDRLFLFVGEHCLSCLPTINRLMSLLSGTQDGRVDVYIRDAQGDDDVRVWALAHNIQSDWLDRQRLTLNRDEGLRQRLARQSALPLMSDTPIFLKRGGRFFQLSLKDVGL